MDYLLLSKFTVNPELNNAAWTDRVEVWIGLVLLLALFFVLGSVKLKSK